MVTFKLKEESDARLVYWYYPNGKEDHGKGVIEIDRLAGRIDVTELAEDDRLVRHSVEAQNQMREAANRMRKIEQMPELTEEEWPTATEERIATIFADHAIKKIVEEYNSGNILTEGAEMWQD